MSMIRELGTIRGTVFDPQQHVVPGATVGSTEGFSVGRVVRLGVRLRF